MNSLAWLWTKLRNRENGNPFVAGLFCPETENATNLPRRIYDQIGWEKTIILNFDKICNQEMSPFDLSPAFISEHFYQSIIDFRICLMPFLNQISQAMLYLAVY